MKGLIRKSIDREINILIDDDHADIGFRDVRIDLHFREIICDRENDGRLQTGSNGLADIDTARNHDAVDGRSNRAMIEIGLRLIERALLDFHIGLGLMQRRRCRIEVGLRRTLFGHEPLDAIGIDARQLQRRLRAREIAFGLRHRRLKKGRIDLRNDLAGFHRRIIINEKFLNVTRDLAPNLHIHDRIQRASGGNGLRDRSARHGRRLKSSTAATPASAQTPRSRAQRRL